MNTPRTDAEVERECAAHGGNPATCVLVKADFARQLEVECQRYRTALETISKWELPPSGRFWADGSQMTYQAAFGSSGARDYMRGVADEALGRQKAESPQAKIDAVLKLIAGRHVADCKCNHSATLREVEAALKA